jgi:hypothetical protein
MNSRNYDLDERVEKNGAHSEPLVAVTDVTEATKAMCRRFFYAGLAFGLVVCFLTMLVIALVDGAR